MVVAVRDQGVLQARPAAGAMGVIVRVVMVVAVAVWVVVIVLVRMGVLVSVFRR